jgi:hypothetical protein
MYDCLYKNSPRILRSIFDAVNKRGGLRWSYHRRVKQTPIWKTKCNGICVVVGAETNINDVVQRAEECTLAGGALLNISANDFHEQAVKNNWHKNSYHTELERYSKDPIPLLWSKDVKISQGNADTFKKLHKQRTEKKASNYRYRPRGRKVRVACTSIGWGIDFATEAYKEAIEWFGGYEVLGLRETYSQPSLPYFARGWKPHKVTVRLPEVENGTTKYRSLSAPISASTREELLQRFEKIRQLSPLHQRVKLEI